MILTTRPALRADAEWISTRLRPEDKAEVETITGLPATEVVPFSFDLSSEAYTFRLASGRLAAQKDPAVLFGVCDDPTSPGKGVMWLVATPEITLAPLSVLRECRYWCEHFRRRYQGGLQNLIDTRNDLHVRWLKLLGFTMGDIYTINGQTFVHASLTE